MIHTTRPVATLPREAARPVVRMQPASNALFLGWGPKF